MLTDPITILAVERYPASWKVSSTTGLNGSCQMGFTAGTDPDASTTWYTASWADTDPTQLSRTTQVMVAGSVAVQAGDAFPGIGDYSSWVRYTDLAGNVRVRPAGLIRFR